MFKARKVRFLRMRVANYLRPGKFTDQKMEPPAARKAIFPLRELLPLVLTQTLAFSCFCRDIQAMFR